MIKVLHILSAVDFGGMSSVVVNYYSNINRQAIHFDIAVTTDSFGSDGNVLKGLGCNFYKLPMKSENLKGYEKGLERILKEGDYSAIHVHENETSFIALRVAKKCGVKCRVAHAHTSSPFLGLLPELRRIIGCFLNYHYCTVAMACGELAAKRVYGLLNYKKNKTVILPNAIQTDKFAFDIKKRDSFRSAHALKQKFAIGMIGRLSPEKNLLFGIRIMPEIKKLIPNAVLICAGDGPEAERMREFVKKNGLEEDVVFLGKIDDVDYFYQGIDLQLIPSFHEGFPVAAVEGLCSGLFVLMSSTITREFDKYTRCSYISIKKPKQWVDAIYKIYVSQNFLERENRSSVLIKSDMDISNTKRILEEVYMGNV